MQLEGGKKYKMDKLLWDAMAASAITITMEDFFSTFLKENNETELCGYVVVFILYIMTIMEYVKWIRRKFLLEM